MRSNEEKRLSSVLAEADALIVDANTVAHGYGYPTWRALVKDLEIEGRRLHAESVKTDEVEAADA